MADQQSTLSLDGLVCSFQCWILWVEPYCFFRWLCSVRRNYRSVTYHNWRHAFNVCQLMFSIITNTTWWKQLGEIECLALVIACLCHDLDHRGDTETKRNWISIFGHYDCSQETFVTNKYFLWDILYAEDNCLLPTDN